MLAMDAQELSKEYIISVESLDDTVQMRKGCVFRG